MKRTNKALSVFLCVLLLAGCLSAGLCAFAGGDPVFAFAISFEEPKAGQDFLTRDDFTVEDGNVEVDLVLTLKLDKANDTYRNDSQGVFRSEQTYMIQLLVKATSDPFDADRIRNGVSVNGVRLPKERVVVRGETEVGVEIPLVIRSAGNWVDLELSMDGVPVGLEDGAYYFALDEMRKKEYDDLIAAGKTPTEANESLDFYYNEVYKNYLSVSYNTENKHLVWDASISKIPLELAPGDEMYEKYAPFVKQYKADSGANVCRWCGKDHSNGLLQKLIGFFHNILARIFGNKY